ncbi:MAG: succinyl-diaminopimelate desuccinylase [Gammaproteobacteria bacterium]|nr:succinyl-diaminopimelate desuccinylase [Gammaproteobacteria bacterium]
MSLSEDITNLLKQLVACQSITPKDADCQAIMIAFLKNLGFHCQQYDNPPVSNFYAEYGQGETLLLLAGHTDVVPAGDLSLWDTDPFELVAKDDILYGRGVADMKGSLAAMLLAAQRWVTEHPDTGRLGFLITSGEEGNDFALGTPYLMSQLQARHIQADFCIVGEPSSNETVGDVIKIGRRGSLHGSLRLQGKQGHVAYPHLADNPIHKLAPAMAELSTMVWDQGSKEFPPTSFQITHIHAGGEATNIIPQDIQMHFNLRFSTEHTVEHLQQLILDCLKRHHLKPEIEWTISGHPFLTNPGRLRTACQNIIHSRTQQTPECSTSGGTSDGRFIAPHGVEVVELGPVNQTIHQVNEAVALADLVILTDLYYGIIQELLRHPSSQSPDQQ